jgi:hypothetical protein
MLYVLQISEIPWFFIVLLLMHGGIAGLIILKKKYKELDKKIYYRNIYIIFALFIPILFYKLVAAIFSFEENHTLIQYVSIGIIVIGLVVGLLNVFIFRRKHQL